MNPLDFTPNGYRLCRALAVMVRDDEFAPREEMMREPYEADSLGHAALQQIARPRRRKKEE